MGRAAWLLGCCRGAGLGEAPRDGVPRGADGSAGLGFGQSGAHRRLHERGQVARPASAARQAAQNRALSRLPSGWRATCAASHGVGSDPGLPARSGTLGAGTGAGVGVSRPATAAQSSGRPGAVGRRSPRSCRRSPPCGPATVGAARSRRGHGSPGAGHARCRCAARSRGSAGAARRTGCARPGPIRRAARQRGPAGTPPTRCRRRGRRRRARRSRDAPWGRRCWRGASGSTRPGSVRVGGGVVEPVGGQRGLPAGQAREHRRPRSGIGQGAACQRERCAGRGGGIVQGGPPSSDVVTVERPDGAHPRGLASSRAGTFWTARVIARTHRRTCHDAKHTRRRVSCPRWSGLTLTCVARCAIRAWRRSWSCPSQTALGRSPARSSTCPAPRRASTRA